MTSEHLASAFKRSLLTCAALAATSIIVHAQTAATETSTAPVPSEQVVRMDQFEVTTTQGHGYVATNASEAFKTNSSLMDIPQVDTVVSNDLITDIGYENLGDVLQYFGVISSYSSESVKIPGGGQLYADEFPIHAGWTDTHTIDSVEIIKGGAEGLYMLNSGLGGIIMKTMKKPIPQGDSFAEKGTVWVNSDTWGLWMAGLDATGPIGKVGDVSLGYRIIADIQRGNTWLTNVVDQREELFPYFEGIYKNTTVRFHYDLEKAYGSQFGSEPITPQGQVYLAAGRRESFVPPNNENTLNTDTWEGTLTQRFSDSWEMRLSGQYFYQIYEGAQVLDNLDDWYNNTTPYVLYTNRHNFQGWKYWTVLNDISGKYDLGPASFEMHQSDVFGWAFTDQITYKYIFSTTVVPFTDSAQGIALIPGQTTSTYAILATNTAAISSLVNPPLSSYYQSPTVNNGSHTTIWNGGFYWQHDAELIPNWLDITTGFSWITVVSDNVTNITTVPWQATELHYDELVHRIAGRVYPFGNKQFMIYALEATNFSPGTTVTYLASGASAPPQSGLDRELGAKWLLLGGRLSADFRWEQQGTTNVTVAAGTFPNGTTYSNLAGSGKEEGVDGDLAVTILPGWQLVGSFYAGHNRDQNNNPISGSWDNSIGLFSRYDFQPGSTLHGLSIGGGYSRVGSRWISTNGLVDATQLETPYTIQTGEIKVDPTNMTNVFVNYNFGKHFALSVNVANVLNKAFILDIQQISIADLEEPRTFRFEADYKF